MVPVVLGTTVSHYEKIAPPNSFIHVDNFTSPKALADYLHYLGNEISWRVTIVFYQLFMTPTELNDLAQQIHMVWN